MKTLKDRFLGESSGVPTTWGEVFAALDALGLINIGRLNEIVIADERKVALCENPCEKGKDFVDTAEAKLTTLRPCKVGKCWVANVTSLINKIGLVLCTVIDPITEKEWYFRIPNSAYAGQTSFQLCFDENRQPTSASSRYTKFNVSTFEEMCAA